MPPLYLIKWPERCWLTSVNVFKRNYKMHVGGVGWWTQGRWITCQKWCIVNVIVILWQDPQKWRSFDAPVFTWQQHGQTDPGAKEFTIHWLLNPRLWSCTNSRQTLSLRMIKQQRLAKISCMLTERAISFHTKPSDPLAAITYRHREKVSMVLTFWTETNKSGLQLGCIYTRLNWLPARVQRCLWWWHTS